MPNIGAKPFLSLVVYIQAVSQFRYRLPLTLYLSPALAHPSTSLVAPGITFLVLPRRKSQCALVKTKPCLVSSAALFRYGTSRGERTECGWRRSVSSLFFRASSSSPPQPHTYARLSAATEEGGAPRRGEVQWTEQRMAS